MRIVIDYGPAQKGRKPNTYSGQFELGGVSRVRNEIVLELTGEHHEEGATLVRRTYAKIAISVTELADLIAKSVPARGAEEDRK